MRRNTMKLKHTHQSRSPLRRPLSKTGARPCSARGAVSMMLFLALFSTLVCGPTRGETPPEKPVVLLVNIGDSSFEKEIERRFVTDLGLYIEDFSVEQLDAPTSDFVGSPLSRQIELIKPIMKGRDAVAVMWLHPVSKDVLLLQVVVLDTGRALVRLFEHSLSKEGSQEALALTAAELLGTAYLFDTEPKKRSASIRKLVEKTRDKAVSPDKKWGFSLSAATTNDIIETIGPTIRTGGLLGVERILPPCLTLGLALGGRTGPLGRDRNAVTSGYELLGAVHLFIGPHLDRVQLGPILTLQAGPGNTRIQEAGHPKADFSYWHVRGELGVEFRAHVSKRMALRFNAGIGVNARRLKVKLASSDRTIQQAGLLTFSGAIGLIAF